METATEWVELQTDLRKTYEKPEIVYELELETRAGSPIPQIFPDPLYDILFENERKFLGSNSQARGGSA
jgi:hypothetical protein